MALDEHPSLEAAALPKTRAATARVQQAHSGYLPHLELCGILDSQRRYPVFVLQFSPRPDISSLLRISTSAR